MPAPLKIDLSEEEDKNLLELQKLAGIPYRVKERAEIIRLRHYGWSVEKIAQYKGKSPHTVRDCFHRWKKRGMEGLWEKMGRGRKKKWKEDDLVYVEKCLEEDSRTYNAAQLARKLATERKVVLSQDRLRKILKARGWVWKRTRYKQPNGADPQVKLAKKADLDWLFWAHSAGEIRLKFLDESGFSLWSPVSYTYARLGEQKVLEQTKRRGKRLNILGLYSLGVSFDYGLKLGSLYGDTYIKLLEWQTQLAAQHFEKTGEITVIVQDNHPIHTSKQVREYWDKWQQPGLFFFQLPKYSSEMNLIETEWHQLKTHELAGQIFPDEYDLAIAVKQGIEARAQKGGYETHCFKFNSA